LDIRTFELLVANDERHAMKAQIKMNSLYSISKKESLRNFISAAYDGGRRSTWIIIRIAVTVIPYAVLEIHF